MMTGIPTMLSAQQAHSK